MSGSPTLRKSIEVKDLFLFFIYSLIFTTMINLNLNSPYKGEQVASATKLQCS